MKWQNLKENKCPQCDKDFTKGLEVQITRLGEKLLLHYCGFKIRETRFSQIVNSQVSKDLEREWDEEAKTLSKSVDKIS